MADTASLIERLEDNSIPEPNSGCWLWLGAVTTARVQYGSLRIGGMTHRVHRLSWEAHRGPIPAGMLVCHSCDIGICINPDHLFLGTHRENNSDMRNKRRDFWHRRPDLAADNLKAARAAVKKYAVGEAIGVSKLNPESVRGIRVALRTGATQRDIASQFGISQAVVSGIANNKGWSHVPD